MKNLKSKTLLVMLSILLVLGINQYSFAATDTTKITLSDDEITVDGKTVSSDSSQDVYLTTSMNNGGTSSEALDANIAIDNIINITKAGTYEFAGNLSNGQISINSNNIQGQVTIILNNVSITCGKAPAIFVYNTDVSSTNCDIVIKTVAGTTNTITGSKIKQSVQNWEDQDEILYYIDKDYDDEGSYYERYKYDGAISSDISLTFEGEGTLIVNSTAKEGIESKGNIAINSGNYVVNSMDDGINACTDHVSVITINGGNILVNVSEEAEEGDGIDSNGSIYINGGNVYAFASETSQDNGLDSDDGIYINGGYVVATGNMADAVSTESEQKYFQFNFNEKVSKDSLIAITDTDDNPIVAFLTDRSYSILTISTPELTSDDVNVYEGGTIEGEEENGLYTNITSYKIGNKKSYSEVQEHSMPMDFQGREMNQEQDYKVYYITLAVLAVLLVIAILFKIKK